MPVRDLSKSELLTAWRTQPRQVPEAVMLSSARMESGDQGSGQGDRFWLHAERYEREAHKRHPQDSADEWTSFGPFQIMGFNLQPSAIELHRNSKSNPALRSKYLARVCADYDSLMAPLLRSGTVRTAFRKYNGSGPMAEAYADRALAIFSRQTRDGDLLSPAGSRTESPEPLKAGGSALPTLLLLGAAVTFLFKRKNR